MPVIEIPRYPIDRDDWRPLADAPHLSDVLARVEPERPGGPSIALARLDLRVCSTGWIDSDTHKPITPLAWRPIPGHRVAMAGSWKRRFEIRDAACAIRALGTSVFDFTDPACRLTPELPPEHAPREWAPFTDGRTRVMVDEHGNPTDKGGNNAVWTYEEYLRRHRPGVEDAMLLNRLAYSLCEVIVLVLPSGCDSHFDVGMAVASGAKLVVYGAPETGDRMPVHLAASEFVESTGPDRILNLTHAVAVLLTTGR